jgi:phosphatidylserine decarboxylase
MSIRSAALPYVLPAAVASAVLAAAGQFLAAAILAALAAALGAFFRDPTRHSESPAHCILSPADGRVVEVTPHDAGVDLAIFLSVFNVHVTRAPVGGELRVWERIAGGYAMAFRRTASQNARHRVLIDTAHGTVELSLIAGAVARRVVPFVAPPAALRRGQRIALIKFGSRAELRLPAGHVAVVSVGDHVRAGETVIAESPRPEVD